MVYLIYQGQISSQLGSVEILRWNVKYDEKHLDLSPTIITNFSSGYGIFKFNSGIYRYIYELPAYIHSTYLVGFKIEIITYNNIPMNCGIQFQINNTYYGSIYRNASGIQTHRIKVLSSSSQSSIYYQSMLYILIAYFDIPKYSFLFSAIGNYTDDTAGWGMHSLKISSGYCPINCKLCEVSFKCKTCSNGYYLSRNGICLSSCSSPDQKLVGQYCQNYDEETPYSQYLIREYENTDFDPNQYAQYTLISQNGTNFLKGSDIYFSYLLGRRVFGGPFVWAQAKFQRIHNMISPHHSLTIIFYIVYGSQFPSDGQFIYTIENNITVSRSITNNSKSNSDGTKQDAVLERILHNTDSLSITWECYGPNNEPIKGFCGFHTYYIIVHNCQPYCLVCSNETTCTSWNSTYDSNINKFSQAECLTNQYYHKESVRCLDCPQSCLTCTSQIDCQTCKSTYILTKLGCTCMMNQYEESGQCFDCSIECNQCLSYTYCIECLNSNYRELLNGQCNCIDGYYPIVQKATCQLCHQFCKTCIGPTSADCLTCNDISNIEKVGSTCQCQAGTFYQDENKACSNCHLSCQTCFRISTDGCLTCDPILNRILKGLQCVCAPGYYELNNICINCPDAEDSTLSQCYKLCNNNQLIWHKITCNFCDNGFQLVSGECQPICGDLQIKGDEQCEDNNTILNDLCYNCQFQCPAHCLTCDSSTTLPCPDVCGDGIVTGFEECEDGNTIQYDGCYNCKYQCQPQCTKCIKKQCFECATPGWFIDPTVDPWQCKERCGDMLVVGNEQCDDGNLTDTYGCKNCKYFCRIGCSSCDYTNNLCLSCEFEGFTPQKYYCRNICGDGLIVNDPYGFYFEQCDDGNTIKYDGCDSDCRFQCQLSSICTSCIDNRCQECAVGYQLSDAKICIAICGDLIKVVNEQCESGFILPYQGCQNCIAKCQSSCVDCYNSGLGCKSCKTNYKKINNLCYPICGDQIITPDEECDDGNLTFGDGCHQCLFSCPISCSICLKGVCYDCKEGYYTLGKGCIVCQSGFENIDNTCYPICGDKIIVAEEWCDDGNLIYEDGCYQCSFTCSETTCTNCRKGLCLSCPENHFLYQNQCFQLAENIHFKQITNFEVTDLRITQNFIANSYYTSRINMKIHEFMQYEYNQIRQYLEIMDQSFSYISIDIVFQCSENKQVISQFISSNYPKGNENLEQIYQYQCHNEVDHTITFSFRLSKIVVRDEILLIKISGDDVKLSSLSEKSPQRILQITIVDF
ncbi:unnamed protein product [Paramecium octaurelia]|uniref:EGF-like domain-containing protein n=1 Tax=Paramecium octaurelia TaxID=43137 RepID=A0A8S1XJI0_PAROT|nr:unnamed protein product [Paramecium octaurelia]